MMKLWIVFYAILGQAGVMSKPTIVTVRPVYLDTGKPADGQQIKLFEGKPSLASTTRTTQTTDSEGTLSLSYLNHHRKAFGSITTMSVSEAALGKIKSLSLKFSPRV